MGGWLTPIQALFHSGDPLVRRILLSIAIAAGAAVQETSGHQVRGMREHGLKLYGEALAEVSAALMRDETAKSDRILGAVKLFSMHEVGLDPCSGGMTDGNSLTTAQWMRPWMMVGRCRQGIGYHISRARFP